MTVGKFFELLESHAELVNVDLYFGDECEEALSLTGDKVLRKYRDRELLSFDIGCGGISIAIED